MGLETGTYISDLVVTNPVSSDPKSQGDDHFRLIKSTVKTTFPNIDGAMTASEEELNILDGATLSTSELNILDGVTASTAEINLLDGVTATTTEINYIDGVTSPLQAQIDLKAPLASPALTGAPTAPTASTGTSSTQIATTEFVANTSFTTNLPAQTGNNGKLLKTDGTNAAWADKIDTTIVTPVTGTTFATTTGTQTLTNKTLQTPVFQDSSDSAKKANLILSGITSGQNRNITIADESMTLYTPGMRLLSTVTASASATADVEVTFDATYDSYLILAEGVLPATNNVEFGARLKIGGSYQTGATDYTFSRMSNNAFSSANSSSISIAPSLTNAAGNVTRVSIFLGNPESSTEKKIISWVGGGSDGSLVGSGFYNASNAALTGVRFLMVSGNISAGIFRLYGIIRTA